MSTSNNLLWGSSAHERYYMYIILWQLLGYLNLCFISERSQACKKIKNACIAEVRFPLARKSCSQYQAKICGMQIGFSLIQSYERHVLRGFLVYVTMFKITPAADKNGIQNNTCSRQEWDYCTTWKKVSEALCSQTD